MKRRSGPRVVLVLASLVALSTGWATRRALAAEPPPPLPSGDVAGSADSPLVKRYQGSVILSYDKKRYGGLSVPLSKLEMVPGKRNSGNNAIVEAKQSKTLEGEITHLLYLVPAERSALEVVRYVKDEIKAQQGTMLYECKAADCGGNPTGNSLGGGGTMGMAMYLRDGDQVTDKPWSLPWCAQHVNLSDLHFLVGELPHARAHVSVLAATMNDASGGCGSLKGRTLAVVDVVQSKGREKRMVTVPSAEMAKALASEGKIALYGVHFESNKAEIKPASEPTLAEIGKLLKDDGVLKLLVVGHTDNTGGFSANMDLSQRRAAAVVKALVERFGVKKGRLTPVGVSSAAPVGSNKTEDGRAKNRRVELVEN